MTSARLYPTVVAAALLAACNYDPAALDSAPVSVQILAVADTLLFGTTMAATAELRNAADIPLTKHSISWTSSDPDILSVNMNGVITAHRPGGAYIRAEAGGARDSVRVRVSMAACRSPGEEIGNAGSNYRSGWVAMGAIDGPMQYRGVSMLFAAGILYGTDATNTVGYRPSFASTNLTGRMCSAPSGLAFHTVGEIAPLVSANGNLPARGLNVVQDFYAFSADTGDDFLLMRYEFANAGSTAITGLRVGMAADLDVYTATNVGSFEPVNGVADVASPDSAVLPFISGILAVDQQVEAYMTYGTSTSETSASMFGYLSGGITAPLRTAPMDVRQLIGVAPFNLAPGENKAVWFALVSGENRAAFNLHTGQAIAMARFLEGNAQ